MFFIKRFSLRPSLKHLFTPKMKCINMILMSFKNTTSCDLDRIHLYLMYSALHAELIAWKITFSCIHFLLVVYNVPLRIVLGINCTDNEWIDGGTVSFDMYINNPTSNIICDAMGSGNMMTSYSEVGDKMDLNVACRWFWWLLTGLFAFHEAPLLFSAPCSSLHHLHSHHRS